MPQQHTCFFWRSEFGGRETRVRKKQNHQRVCLCVLYGYSLALSTLSPFFPLPELQHPPPSSSRENTSTQAKFWTLVRLSLVSLLKMAPPQESNGVAFGQHEVASGYGTEPKRMRLSGAAAAAAAAAAVGSSTTTRASTGAPTAMTNKGSVYKAQRGRGKSAERRWQGHCFVMLRARRIYVGFGVSSRRTVSLGALSPVQGERGNLARYLSNTENYLEKRERTPTAHALLHEILGFRPRTTPVATSAGNTAKASTRCCVAL